MMNKLMGILSGDKEQLALKVVGGLTAALLIVVGQMQPSDQPWMPV